jgi:hypothetical protein
MDGSSPGGFLHVHRNDCSAVLTTHARTALAFPADRQCGAIHAFAGQPRPFTPACAATSFEPTAIHWLEAAHITATPIPDAAAGGHTPGWQGAAWPATIHRPTHPAPPTVGSQALSIGARRAAKARLPRRPIDAPAEVILINTAGGLTGGDRLDWTFDVDGTNLIATTQAAEKIYRSLGNDAEIHSRLTGSSGARLYWLPQEAILFDGARLRRTLGSI